MASTPPTLGTRIRRARERARLSQEELAQAVGASVRAVGDWENDRRRPRNRIGTLEEVLGVRLGDEAEPDIVPPGLREAVREILPPDRAKVVEAAIEAALRGDPPARGPSGQREGRAAAG